MPITDKIAAAKKISELLNGIITTGDFRLRYKIMVDPPAADHDFVHPEIMVDLSGADSPLVQGTRRRTAARLRARRARNAAARSRRARQGHLRLPELPLGPHAGTASLGQCCRRESASSGMPYAFAPMSSRERRIVHLALRDLEDLRTESAGEALQRYVVVYPKDYTGQAPGPAGCTRGGDSS